MASLCIDSATQIKQKHCSRCFIHVFNKDKEKKNTQKSKKTPRLYIIKTKSHKKSLNEKKKKRKK